MNVREVSQGTPQSPPLSASSSLLPQTPDDPAT
jgi:hypothetical protein